MMLRAPGAPFTPVAGAVIETLLSAETLRSAETMRSAPIAE
ncbi:hypothetical protein ACWEWX_37670 [Streptomyces asiaticus]